MIPFDHQRVDPRQLRGLVSAFLKIMMRPARRTGVMALIASSIPPLLFGGVLVYSWFPAVRGDGGGYERLLVFRDLLHIAFAGITCTLVFAVSMAAAASASDAFSTMEYHIFGPTPMTSSTYRLAHLVVSVIGLTRLAFLMNAVPLLWLFYKFGSGCTGFVVAYLFSVALGSCFAFLVVALLFGVLAKLFRGRRWWPLLPYGGLILSMGFCLAVPFYLGTHRLHELPSGLHRQFLLGLFPPAWFTGLCLSLSGHAGVAESIFSGLAFAATSVTMWIYLRFALAGRFEYIARLLELPVAIVELETTRYSRLRQWMGGLILRNHEKRAGFDLAVRYLRRDRETKAALVMTLAPLLLAVPISIIQAVYGDDPGSQDPGNWLRLAIAFPALVAAGGAGVLRTFRYSSSPAAVQSLFAGPLQRTHLLLDGVRTAVYLVLVSPLLCLSFALSSLIWGVGTGAMIILPWFPLAAVSLHLAVAAGRFIPFGESWSRRRPLLDTSVLVVFLFALSILGTIQSLVMSRPAAYWGFFVSILLLCAVMGVLARGLMLLRSRKLVLAVVP